MIILRPQSLEIRPPQRIDQVVREPSGSALVTPGGAVEPPFVEAGKDEAGVDRLACRPELHDEAGGLDASPDSLRDELGRGADIALPRRGPASHESCGDEQQSMQHIYARRRRYLRAGVRSIASATTMPATVQSD